MTNTEQLILKDVRNIATLVRQKADKGEMIKMAENLPEIPATVLVPVTAWYQALVEKRLTTDAMNTKM